jgi:putative endonuclease
MKQGVSRRRSARLPDPRRVAAETHGRVAEWVALAALVLRGYRILARRHRNRAGEIDLIACRGRRLAFVEVKLRASLHLAEETLRDADPRRLHASAGQWVSRRPGYSDYEQGFDAVLVVPWRWPSYRRDALQPVL